MTRKTTKWLCVVALAVAGNAYAQNGTSPHGTGSTSPAGTTGDTVHQGAHDVGSKSSTLIDPTSVDTVKREDKSDRSKQFGMDGKGLGETQQLGLGQGSDKGLKSLDRNEVRELQRALKQYGFYDGEIDGVVGPNTYAALGAFKHSRGTTVSGRIDSTTATALGIEIQWQRGSSSPMQENEPGLGEIQPVRGGDEDSLDIPSPTTNLDFNKPSGTTPSGRNTDDTVNPPDAPGDEMEGNMGSGNTTPGTGR